MADPQDRPDNTSDPVQPPPPADSAPTPAESAAPPPAPEPGQPAKKAPGKKATAKAAKKAAPAKAAKKAAAKKPPAKKPPAKEVPAKKAPAKKVAPAAAAPSKSDTNGQLAAAAKDVAAQAKATVEAARNPLPTQPATSSSGRSPVALAVAIGISLLAVLLVRQLRRDDD